MRKIAAPLALACVLLGGCSSSSTPVAPIPISVLPSPSNNGTVPASIVATSGYSVHVFATPPSGSTKPDSLVQIGRNVFVGFGDTLGPDGAPGTGGKTSVEIVRYDLTGKIVQTYEVPGHNDGLMAFDNSTLWAMSNEDSNAILTIINISTGTQQSYTPQASLVNSTGGLPHGGGLDDMQLIGGAVYVSGSNPTVSTTATCPANSSTPACPNGISTGPFVYALTLNGDGKTFNLTPVATSGGTATNIATGASATFNITDPDSEVVSPDGSTLIVDGQGDSELAFVKNLGSTPAISFLPLGAEQVDDTRFAPSGSTFLVLTDTPANAIYRIDGPFGAGNAFSSGITALDKLNTTSGATTPIVSGFQAPHGLLFVTPQ